MRRPGFTLIELLVVIAIIAALIGLLLPAVQRVRETAARTKCQNHLKQLGVAVHNYESSYSSLPPGVGPSPGQVSVQVLLLPYLEQAAKYQQFDQTKSAFAHPNNHAARVGDIPTYLCPSDRSGGTWTDLSPPPGVTPGVSGRCNYYGNAGAHGWCKDAGLPAPPRPADLTGVFALDSQVRLGHVRDGTSNTVLFAEINRGAAPSNNKLDVVQLTSAQWGGGSPATNPSNLSPPAACNSTANGSNVTGLQYYRGIPTAAFYTHTVPPNYAGRDCFNLTGGDQFHLAARSYHPGGVNVVLVDGSVRFIRDSIPPNTWKALGTRSGGEPIDQLD